MHHPKLFLLGKTWHPKFRTRTVTIVPCVGPDLRNWQTAATTWALCTGTRFTPWWWPTNPTPMQRSPLQPWISRTWQKLLARGFVFLTKDWPLCVCYTSSFLADSNKISSLCWMRLSWLYIGASLRPTFFLNQLFGQHEGHTKNMSHTRPSEMGLDNG